MYKGEWKHGVYDGKGECKWSDGRHYEGEWSGGKAHGVGKETNPDGTIRHDGQWEYDRPIRDYSNSAGSGGTTSSSSSKSFVPKVGSFVGSRSKTSSTISSSSTASQEFSGVGDQGSVSSSSTKEKKALGKKVSKFFSRGKK